jgi:hypothetical protein
VNKNNPTYRFLSLLLALVILLPVALPAMSFDWSGMICETESMSTTGTSSDCCPETLRINEIVNSELCHPTDTSDHKNCDCGCGFDKQTANLPHSVVLTSSNVDVPQNDKITETVISHSPKDANTKLRIDPPQPSSIQVYLKNLALLI